MQEQKPDLPFSPPPKRGVKDFFRIVFASMLGFIIASTALNFIFFGFILMIIALSSSSEVVTVKQNSILKITMKEKIVDSPQNENDFISQMLGDEIGKKRSLQEYINAINKAKDDPNIKAIYLELSDANADAASLDEIWSTLSDFKKNGKSIIAYSDFLDLRGLFMASVADKVYLNPRGGILFKGLSAEVPMFKGLLNSIGIEPQVVRAGKYKSAVEPFVANSISEENRTQLREYLNGLWESLLTKISKKTKLDSKALNQIADSLKVYDPATALKTGLVDGLCYRDQIDSLLKKNLSLNDEPVMLSFGSYLKTGVGSFEYNNADYVKIIYAEGDIVMGESDENNIGSETFCEAVREAAKDESVKAVVIRVNSPGGSAIASDIMYRELLLLKAKKPVIVSMGNYAASGGYYISAPADVIVASPNTLTGSIGVFGLVFNTQKLMRDKLGISFDTVKTNSYSDFFSGNRPLSAYEMGIMQLSVDTTYDAFLGCVATGRKMRKEKINELGQGRIWFAQYAKANKLVDTLGGLFDAVKIAASKAKLKNYSISYTSTARTFFEKLMKNLNAKININIFHSKETERFDFYLKEVEKLSRMSGVQMIMPFSFNW
jgi:protease-4